ncbi:cob(I)yrinic acid a,c-diamide adenosyltransferase [Candidatus Woesearchaeota archaeon]|nr:cob(I)yrinic acid a,c-diamide adenosyltransferase [Candidatus Woesearchaeota archaeon]
MVTKLRAPIIVEGDSDKTKLGLIHIYTGDGKGKTTASLGLALRALGCGYRVYMIQFLKSGNTGELHAMEKFTGNFVIEQFGSDAIKERQQKLQTFTENIDTFRFNADEIEREACRLGLEKAFSIIQSKEYEMVILDEINCVLDKGLITLEEVKKLFDAHGTTELVLTGRDVPKQLFEHADYISVISREKHPWQKGIKARRGVEY